MDTAYRTSLIRRIRLIGYGVLSSSGTVYWGPWVWRIGLLRQWSFDSSKSWIRRIGVDIDTLTMEQYLALSREKKAPGPVKLEIGGNVNIKIKSQFMRELREDTFSGNKNEDAHDHIDLILSIVGLFNIPGVSKDAVML
ncbi:hypothetical protein Tco_0359923 [Tanacetum coccineum]